jgi:hypothetical protein
LVTRAERIEVLLAEYQASYMNRDHYDSVRWLIGSIFIAASFTLLGASFLDPVARDIRAVGFLGIISIVLMLLWVLYDHRVSPWIRIALRRCAEIEDELRKLGFEIGLHSSIREYDKSHHRKSAGWYVAVLLILVCVAWIFRVAFM